MIRDESYNIESHIVINITVISTDLPDLSIPKNYHPSFLGGREEGGGGQGEVICEAAVNKNCSQS